MRRYNITLLVSLLAFFWSATGYAVQVSIDTFSIQQNSTVLLNDTFSDGVPPPSGPLDSAITGPTYGVNSTLSAPNQFPIGAETPGPSGTGLLQMDSANGVSSVNAGGGARLNLRVTPTVDSLAPFTSSSGVLLMTGVFTLPAITGPLNNGYGIRFIDSASGSSQEVLELNVQWWTGGKIASDGTVGAGWYIRYLVQDFTATPNYGVPIYTVGADLVNIPTGDTEICLSLSRPDVSGPTVNDFYASYAYGTGGTCVTGTGGNLGFAAGFLYGEGTNAPIVRGQFHAFETVPEPGAWLLMGVGLAGLVARRRGKIWN